FAFGGERRVARATVLLALAPLHEAAFFQGVDEEGDPAAGHEDLALDVPQQERPFVVEHLQDRELARGEAVTRDVHLAVREHGRVRTGKHGPQFQRERLGLAPFGRATGARPGIRLAHEATIRVRQGTCQGWRPDWRAGRSGWDGRRHNGRMVRRARTHERRWYGGWLPIAVRCSASCRVPTRAGSLRRMIGSRLRSLSIVAGGDVVACDPLRPRAPSVAAVRAPGPGRG